MPLLQAEESFNSQKQWPESEVKAEQINWCHKT